MMKLQVFDPAMCCSTGVCGPAIDPALARFSADLQWLESQGVAVERFNLAQQPQTFAESQAVLAALKADGNECLPLVVLNGEIVSRSVYPSRGELGGMVGIPTDAEVETDCCGTPSTEKNSDCCGPDDALTGCCK